MVSITLYAQPKSRGSLLNASAMKKGQFQLESSASLNSTIFTDVCDTFYKVIRMQDPNCIPSVIRAISATDTSATWIIGIESRGNKFSLKREMYRGTVFGAENVQNYLVTISYDGDENYFTTIVKDVVKLLGFVPNDMADWSKFTKKTGAQQSDVIAKWRQYTEAPTQPTQTAVPATIASMCPSCHKSVASDFAMCPYCGSKLGTPTCQNCHKEIGADFKMCPYCGTQR